MFGQYKQSLNNTLVSNYSNKKLFKKTFHNLMQGLRENKLSREFFVLYGEIENKRFDDKDLAEVYLNEVIRTLKSKKKNLKIPIIKEQNESNLTDDGTIVCVTGGKASGRGAGKWVAINKMVHREKLGNVVVGTVVTTDGNKTKVTEIWKDSKDRPGAFKFANKNTSATEVCFSVASTKTSGFVNKTVNYVQIDYTIDDIKSGKVSAKIGDKDKTGEVIKTVQKLVGAKPDGYFGPNTLKKVQEYQKANKFAVTGKIDKETLGGGSPDIDKTKLANVPANTTFEQGIPKVKDAIAGTYYQNTNTKQKYYFTGKKYVELTDDLELTEHNNTIYSQLDSLIFNDSVRAIEKNLRNKRSLVEHLTREDKVSKMNGLVSNSIFSSLATKKFNEKYSTLEETDKTKLKKLLSLTKEEISVTMKELKENTLKQLDTLTVEAEKDEMKTKLKQVSESIVNSKNDALSIIKIENLNKSLIK